MSGVSKSSRISLAELRDELQRKLDLSSAHGQRPSQGSTGTETSGGGLLGSGIGAVQGRQYTLRRFVEDDDKQELETWIKMARQPGVFYSHRCQLVRLLQPRAFALARSCDAIDPVVSAKFARIFCTRWAFLDSEARDLFGEYYHPLLATRWLERGSFPPDVARHELHLKVSASDIAADGTVGVVYPEPELIDLAAWHSTTLSFIMAFAAQRTQIENERGRTNGETPEYPPLWITAHKLLSEPSSSLYKALRAPAPPQAELDILGDYFSLRPRSYSGDRRLSLNGRRDPKAVRADLKAALPTATKDGSVSLVIDSQLHQWKLVCSPAVQRAVLDGVPDLCPQGAHAQHLPLAQSIVMSLGDHERAEAVAVLYGALTRGDLELKANGELALTPFGKLASKLWPGISPLSSRWLLELVFNYTFYRYQGITAPLDHKVCAVEDLVRDRVTPTRFLGDLPYVGELITLFQSVPDREWIRLSDLGKLLNVRETGRYGVIGNPGERYALWVRECMVGWWCGFLDLAFTLDKKGLKSEVEAFRVNRGALRSVVIPELVSPESPARSTGGACVSTGIGDKAESASVPRFGAECSCFVDVLPNGEILCPPNLHPAIRFCLATVCTYKRSNTFAVPERAALSSLPLDLCSSDLYRFISTLSRHPLPGPVKEALEGRQVVVPRIGLYTPSFVLTTIDRARVEKLLDDLNPQRYFAAEIAPDVWGIYDGYDRAALDGLRDFEATSRSSTSPAIGKVVKMVSKRGERAFCDLHALARVGAVPLEGLGQKVGVGAELSNPRSGLLPQPLQSFLRYFDLAPDENALWEEKASVEIFSTIPSEVQTTRLFTIALAPCLKLASTRSKHL